MYSDIAFKFLDYDKRNPEGDPDIYNRFKSFLLFIGYDKQAADHEVAIFMNTVCDLMD